MKGSPTEHDETVRFETIKGINKVYPKFICSSQTVERDSYKAIRNAAISLSQRFGTSK